MPFLNLAQYSFLSLVVMGGVSEKGRRSFRKILSKYVNSKQSKTDKGSRGDRIGASGPPGLSAILIFSAFLLSGKVEK